MTEHVFSVYVEINVPVRVAASDDELAAVLAGRVGKRLSARLIAALKAEAIEATCRPAFKLYILRFGGITAVWGAIARFWPCEPPPATT